MRTLQFEVRGQYITRIDEEVPVAKCMNVFKAHFDFLTEEWVGTKTAIFAQGGYSKSQILDENDECIVPWEFFDAEEKTRGYVSVYCGELMTANESKVTIAKSGYKESDASVPPTPDVYQQILENLDGKLDKAGHVPDKYLGTDSEGNVVEKEAPSGGGSGTTDYNSLENKPHINGVELRDEKTLEELGIQEKGNYASKEEIPTSLPASDVYDWAKEPEKPAYTPEEVGALPKETKIPSKLSDMEADEAHRTVTDEEKDAWNAKSDFTGKYEDLQEKPSKFTPSEHKHAKAEITDFAHGHSWNEIEGKPVIPQVPDKLPNPHKLVMTGAVEAEYDGSGEVTVEIPEQGGIDLNPELTEYYTVAKKNIKEAIVNKGVQVGDDVSLNDYAKKIGEIPSAVSPTEDLPEQTVITGYGLQETVGVKLNWKNVNAAGYLVRRKLGGIPLSTADGDTVCDIADTSYTDTGVQKGLEYYYRIFPYNSKRQFQAELGASTVRVEYKDRENQVQVGDLDLGDMIKFGRYGTSDYFWKVCDTLTKKDGYISVAAEQNLGNMQWDVPENDKEKPNPITNRKNQGNNRYAFSNVRQILNSDKEKDTWFVKQHEYDVAPGHAKTYDGFLFGFTEYEKEVIYTRSIACVLDDTDGGGSETVEDKIWLPSSYDMGLEVKTEESDHAFDGFPDNESRKYQNNYWLRTMNGNASGVRNVYAAGALGGSNAFNYIAVRPFCSLPTSAYLRWSDSDNAYVFADDSQRNEREMR